MTKGGGRGALPSLAIPTYGCLSGQKRGRDGSLWPKVRCLPGQKSFGHPLPYGPERGALAMRWPKGGGASDTYGEGGF
jgi:hypothetical protein